MRRVSTFPVVRTVVIAIIVMLMPYTVPGAMAAIKVNCNVVGQTITAAIAANPDVSPLVLQVKGTCTENITIIRDDVTIKTNGVAHATIHAADPTQPTVLLDGARNIVIDGKVANGISVTGGTFNIDATRGSSLSIANCVVSGASNTGIISAFQAVMLGGMGDPRMLAKGISEALLCTAGGLTVAIPAYIAHRYLRGKVERIVVEMEKIAVNFADSLDTAPQTGESDGSIARTA